jgi:hypothetical protein
MASVSQSPEEGRRANSQADTGRTYRRVGYRRIGVRREEMGELRQALVGLHRISWLVDVNRRGAWGVWFGLVCSSGAFVDIFHIRSKFNRFLVK